MPATDSALAATTSTRRTWVRTRGAWLVLSGLVTMAWMLVQYAIRPMWWYQGDARHQYVPAFRDIGRRILNGELPPTIDPALGPSGAFSLDVQYGTYDPLHWAMSVCAAYVPSLPLTAFCIALTFSTILAVGVTAVCLQHRAPGAWAVAAGLSTTVFGYLAFWISPVWMPGLISVAWVPWLWWAVSGPLTRRRLLAIGLFSYLIIAGGWPSTWLALGALAIGYVAESFVRRDEGRVRERLRPLLLRAGAALAGMLIGFINLVPILQASRSTARKESVHWGDLLIIQPLDALNTVAGQTTTHLRNFGGEVEPLPVYFFGWFLVVLLCAARWQRDVWRRPGVLTGIVASLLMLALTQLPSSLGPLRSQIRQLVGFQVLAVITVLIVVGHLGLTWTRRRTIALVVATGALVGLAAARSVTPGDAFVSSLVTAAAVAGVATSIGLARNRTALSGVVAIVGTLALSAYTWLSSPMGAMDSVALTTPQPAPLLTTARDRPVLAMYPQPLPLDSERWMRDGIGIGFERLTRTNRVMPGYSSVSSKAWRHRFQTYSSQGYSKPITPPSIFEREPSTDRPWWRLLGLRTVIVHTSLVGAFEAQPKNPFEPSGITPDFVQYTNQRPRRFPGRVTLATHGIDVEAVDVQRDEQTYDIDAHKDGRIVFQDLYWPGFTATLDGEPLEVKGLNRLLVVVLVPPDSHGRLVVSWDPIGVGGLLSTVGAGAVVGAVVLLLAGRRRTTRRQASTDASDGTDNGGRSSGGGATVGA